MNKALSAAWLAAAILLSLGGVAGFILLFVPVMNVFWIILTPIIIAVYQFPAVAVFYFWKKRKRREMGKLEEKTSQDSESAS